jgi:hypothetical protein
VHEALMREGLGNKRKIVSAVALRLTVFWVEGYKIEAQSIGTHLLLPVVSTKRFLGDASPCQSTGFLLGRAHWIEVSALLGEAKAGGPLLKQLVRVGVEEKDVENLTSEVQTCFHEISELA